MGEEDSRRAQVFRHQPQAAFKLYQHQKDDLEAGRTPKPLDDYHLNVKDMVNLCLTVKKEKVASGELDRRTFREYAAAGGGWSRSSGERRWWTICGLQTLSTFAAKWPRPSRVSPASRPTSGR